MAPETREELEASRSRLAFAADNATRRANWNYNRLRQLENKVRLACDLTLSLDERMAALAFANRLVPKNPRPTLTEIRKGGRRGAS